MSEEAPPPYENKEDLPPPYEEPKLDLKRVQQEFVTSITPKIRGYPSNHPLVLGRVSLFFNNLLKGVFTSEVLDILLPYFMGKRAPTLEYVNGDFSCDDQTLPDYKRSDYEDFVEFADAVVALTKLLLFVPEIYSLNKQLENLR